MGRPHAALKEIAGSAPSGGSGGVLLNAKLARRLRVGLLLAAPLLFLALFYALPLAEIVRLSFLEGTAASLRALLARLFSAGTLRILGFTTGQALLSTAITLILGVIGAYIYARLVFPGKALLRTLITVPFVLPTVVVAAAFSAALGPRSPLGAWIGGGFDLRYTLLAILIAHVFYNYAVVVRLVSGFWSNLDPSLENAARTLGASGWRTFWGVTFPLLLPAIGTAGMLVFIFCFTSFGVVLILGGPRFSTLEVAIYRQTIDFANLPLAAALSLLQVLMTLGFTLVYTRMQGRLARSVELRPHWAVRRPPRHLPELLLVAGNALFSLLLIGFPLAVLVGRSFDAGLRYYAALFENPRRSVFYVAPLAAVGNSVRFALATTALALGLGLLTTLAIRQQRRGWLLDALFMLPLGTSAVTLGLGYLVALDRPPLDLRGTPLLIVFSHTLVALPFVVRSLLPAVQSIRPQLREAASVLGARPSRVFLEVDLPIIWRALGSAAVFAFTISIGEFGATSMIARPELPTMPIAIYRFLSRPGALNYGQAMAMSTLLMAVCAIGFLTVERLSPPGEQPF